MKKVNVFLVMVCLVGIWATSCVKENLTENTKVKNVDKTSTAQLLKTLKTNSTNYGGVYLFSTNIGHKSSDCGGKCKYYNGVWCHVSCQGFGSECTLSAMVNISKAIPDDPYDIYYTGLGINDYEPIEDLTFNMPARSLYIEVDTLENGFIWINIPEQILQRDDETNQFIYKAITFTEEPLFENN
jgi:hypothetical protein